MSGINLTYDTLQGQSLREVVPLVSRQEFQLLESRACQGLGARWEGRLVAVALFRDLDARLVLEVISVDPRYRMMGVGTQLLTTLCRFADARRRDLLLSFRSGGLREPFHRFLTSTGLFTIRRQRGYEAVLPPEAIGQFIQQNPQRKVDAPLFFQQPPLLRREFIHHLEEQYPQIAWELQVTPSLYQEELCRCIVNDGEIQAVCLMEEFETERELRLLYGRPGKGPLAAKALLACLQALGQRPPLPLRFTPVGEAALKLTEKLCPLPPAKTGIYTAYYTGKVQTGGEFR